MDKIKIKTLEEFGGFNTLATRFVNKDNLRKGIIRLLSDNKRDVYCTICEGFNCDCSSSDCFKIKHWDDVFTFLKYYFNVKDSEINSLIESSKKEEENE